MSMGMMARAGRLVDGLGPALQRHQQVQHPHVAQLHPGLQRDQAGGQPQHGGGQQGNPPPVMGIGDGAAHQSTEYQGNQREDAQQAHIEAVLHQAVYLEAYGHQGELAADGGHC
ncbi:hypothetical protein QFZ60_000946 [Arthrobacter sp. B2I5]|nr:hypothetical protein [Arthrobacter sp. B2I5]